MTTTTTTTRTLRLATPLLALGLALTACGGGTGSASGDHNDQDVAFASEMIPHHAQAVQMSDMAADNAGSEAVKSLAEDISDAQGPEIEQMSSWLTAWGEEVPDTDMGGMDHGGMDHGDMDMGDMDMGDMPGMMSPDEMDELESASGSTFDQMFLTMMIEHHEGAIEMAQVEQRDGQNADAIALAETIEETQASEIETMRELLAP